MNTLKFEKTLKSFKAGAFYCDQYESYKGTKSYRLVDVPTKTDVRNLAVLDGINCGLCDDGYFWISF